MAHLTGFGLENFRVLNEKTWFDFAPITILTGPNNSGKSTILKSLDLIEKNTSKNNLASLNLEKSFFTDFKEIKNIKSTKNEIKISFKIKIDSFHHKALNWLFYPESIICLEFVYTKNEKRNKVEVHELSITNTEKELLVWLRIKEVVDFYLNLNYFQNNLSEIKKDYNKRDKKVISFNSRYSLFDFEKFKDVSMVILKKEFTKQFSDSNATILNKIIGIFIQFYFPANCFLHKDIGQMIFDDYSIEEEDYLNIIEFFFKVEHSSGFGSFKNKFLFKFNSATKESEKLKIKDVVDFLKANKLYENEFDFISDLKSSLPDYYLEDIIEPNFFKIYTDIFGKGLLEAIKEAMPTFNLKNISINRSISNRLVPFNHITVDLLTQEFTLSPFDHSKKGNDFLNKWLNKFEIDEIKLINHKSEFCEIRIKRGKKWYDLKDYGYGISQVLPILHSIKLAPYLDSQVKWMYINNIYIEEPESNLHPKYHSLLADFFVDAIKEFRIQFIIETHSEYLIRKLQYLTAKKEITPNDTAIYYFHHPDQIPKGQKQVKRIDILKDGSLSDDFGSGFFDEAANLVSSIWEARSKN